VGPRWEGCALSLFSYESVIHMYLTRCCVLCDSVPYTRLSLRMTRSDGAWLALTMVLALSAASAMDLGQEADGPSAGFAASLRPMNGTPLAVVRARYRDRAG
jgi:hypothetical protein